MKNNILAFGFLSVLVLSAGVVGAVYLNNKMSTDRQLRMQAQDQAKKDADRKSGKETEENRQFKLTVCYNQVDTWYNENLKNTSTVFQEQNLLEQKKQEMDKCQQLYGN